MQQFFGRTFGLEGPGFQHGAVSRKRAQHTHHLGRTLQRHGRVEDHVLRRELQHRGRALSPMRCAQRVFIPAQMAVTGVNAVLGAQHAMALRQQPRAHLLEEFITRGKGQQLLHCQGHWSAFRWRAPGRLGRLRGRGMRGDRVKGVVDVLEIDLPVGAEFGAQHSTGDAQLPLR